MITPLPHSPVRGPSPEPDLGPYYHIPATISYTGPNGFVTRSLCYSSMEPDDSLPAPTEPPPPASPAPPSPPPLENDELLPGQLHAYDDPPRDRPPSPEPCEQTRVRCRGVDGLGCQGMHECIVDLGDDDELYRGQGNNFIEGSRRDQDRDEDGDGEDSNEGEKDNDNDQLGSTSYTLPPGPAPYMGPNGFASIPQALPPVESFGGDDSPAPTGPPPPRRPWSPPSVVGYWPRGWVRYPNGPPDDPPATPEPAHNARSSDVESLTDRGDEDDGCHSTEENNDWNAGQGEDEIVLGGDDQDACEDAYEEGYEDGYEYEYEDAEEQYDDDY